LRTRAKAFVKANLNINNGLKYISPAKLNYYILINYTYIYISSIRGIIKLFLILNLKMIFPAFNSMWLMY